MMCMVHGLSVCTEEIDSTTAEAPLDISAPDATSAAPLPSGGNKGLEGVENLDFATLMSLLAIKTATMMERLQPALSVVEKLQQARARRSSVTGGVGPTMLVGRGTDTPNRDLNASSFHQGRGRCNAMLPYPKATA